LSQHQPGRCPLCGVVERGEARAVAGPVAAVADAYPVGPGHTLIVPLRHEPRFFNLPPEEQAAAWVLARRVRHQLAQEFGTNSFTVGLNDGSAAGQTLTHAHVHVIPRFDGDTDDPRGGVRNVVPARARWWDMERATSSAFS
jgi:diadenosine tetraphosphate (Ap4A) HIT family hydrolase